VLLGRAQQLPIVYVMTGIQQFPVGVASQKSAGIEKPADLAHKRIGLPGTYGASYIGLIALLDSAGLNEMDVSLDSIGFNQVEALMANKDDAVVIYSANEPEVLKSKGVDVNVLKVSDYSPLCFQWARHQRKNHQGKPSTGAEDGEGNSQRNCLYH